MSHIKLTNKEQLLAFLKNVTIESTKKALLEAPSTPDDEHARQKKVAKQIADACGKKGSDKKLKEQDDDSKDKDDSKGKDGSKGKDAETPDDAQHSQLPKHMSLELPDPEDVTVDMINDRLNVIRSGRSLKNERVAVEMNHYFNDLTPTERVTLLAFLTGIASVITTGAEGEDAMDPGDANVKVTSSSDKKVEPQSSTTSDDDEESEDTSPPIQVGKKQATESIRRRIKELL